MKKLLFLFCLILVLLINVPLVKADSLNSFVLDDTYVEVGIGNDEMLNEEPLQIVSGTVDWNTPGTYLVSYMDNLNNVYLKDVHVVSEKESYLMDEDPLSSITPPKDHQVLDVKNISSNSYYLISNYLLPDPSGYDQEKICISFYENNTFKWEYHYYKFSRFLYSKLVNDELIVAGEVYNANETYHNSIVLIKINKDRVILKTKEITSNEACFCTGMDVSDSLVYLVTTTSGTSESYQDINTEDAYRIVILVLGYNSLDIVNYLTLSNIDNFRLIDTSFTNNLISIHLTHNPKIEYNNNSYTHEIIKIRKDLSILNNYYFNLNQENYLFFVQTETVPCIFSEVRVNGVIQIKAEFIDKFYPNSIYYLSRNDQNPINNCALIALKSNSIYLNVSYKTPKERKYLGICRIQKDIEPSYYFNNKPNSSPLSFTIYNNEIYENFIEKDFINTYKLSIIEFSDKLILNDKYELRSKNVYENFSLINDYNDYTPDKTFGSYININEFYSENGNKYYLKSHLQIKLDTNIKNNEVYDVGKNIVVNGTATLNGKEIKNGYVINNIGKYLLVIMGENEENKVLNFEVKNLSVQNIENNPNPLTINSFNVYPSSINKTSEVSYVNNLTLVNKDNDVIPVCISILLVGALAFIFLRKKI